MGEEARCHVAITKLLQEGETCLLSSTVIHKSSVASRKRLVGGWEEVRASWC